MSYRDLETIESSGIFEFCKATTADADYKPDPEWRIYDDGYLIVRGVNEEAIKTEYDRLVQIGKTTVNTYIVTTIESIIKTREVRALSKKEAKSEGMPCDKYNETKSVKTIVELKKNE